MVFQLGGVKRSMTRRQFIVALGLYTNEEMGNNLFKHFYDLYFRNRPHNYDPAEYVVNITTRDHYDTQHLPSYTFIRSLIRCLTHHLLALFVASRHSGKEKVTLDDFFLFHSMDGWVSVDVHGMLLSFSWIRQKGYKKKNTIVKAYLIGRIARSFGLMTPRALRGVTLGPETSLLSVANMDGWVSVDVHGMLLSFSWIRQKGYKKKNTIVKAYLIGRIARSFGLMTPRALRGVTLGPETSLLSVAKLVELGICKYNSLGYGEIVDYVPEVAGDKGARAGMGQADVGGVRSHPNMTTTNRLRAIDESMTSFIGILDSGGQSRRDIHDLGIQQGVNFMSSTPIYSTDPSSSPSLFGLFGDDNAGPSTSRSQQDDMNDD
nr:hypothetical protein [Tanacetum cinerariifolium]